MRILIISTAFPRNPDDLIAKWLAETIRRLSRDAGHPYEFEILTSAYLGGGNRDWDGIPIHRFRYFFSRWERLTHEEAAPDRMRRSPFYAALPLFYLVFGTIAAWRLARRQRYDIVHVHWPFPHALFGWAARFGGARRTIVHFYSVELRWIRHSFPFLKGFIRRAITSADRVVAISNSTAREIKAVAPVSVDVIPYAAELPSMTETEIQQRVSWKRATSTFTILSVGRLVERKGIRYLIEAMTQLPSDLHARAVIIGDGFERENLERLTGDLGVRDRVEFRGRVSPEELHRAYQDADVFALPAIVDRRGDTEGLGVVLLEAMTYGVPVISTPLGGITDIVEADRTGLLVAPNDGAELAKAITRLAKDPALAQRLGMAGRERALSVFSWDSVLSKWRAMYDQVAAPA